MSAVSNIEQLSRQLAALSGLRLRVPQPGDLNYKQAGWLRGLLPDDYFHWKKCPFHDTWLQPAFEPYIHWACAAKDYCKDFHHAGTGHSATHIKCQGHACTFKRAAKMRTKIEQRIFAVYRFLEEHQNEIG